MRRAVFPGSFDPITNGHIDIIRRSLKIFDRVIIGVLHNPEKGALLTIEERLDLIKSEFRAEKSRVQTLSFRGLLVEFLQSVDAHVVVRGLRAISDYDYETQLALMNKKLWSEVETVFMVAREENSYISSSMVKQVALFGGDVSNFVPVRVAKLLTAKSRDRATQNKGKSKKK